MESERQDQAGAIIQLPRYFRITLLGDAQRIYHASGTRAGFHYIVDRLLSGQTVSRRELRRWGVTVELVEDDTDGGPEDLDPLIAPADFSR